MSRKSKKDKALEEFEDGIRDCLGKLNDTGATLLEAVGIIEIVKIDLYREYQEPDD